MLDSIEICEAINNLERSGPKKNKRFQIRLSQLKGEMAFHSVSCEGWRSTGEILKEGLKLAYEIEDSLLIADLNRRLSSHYVQKLDYGSALVYGLTCNDIQEKIGKENFSKMAYFLYDLGYLHFHAREYEAAITSSKEAIQCPHLPDVEIYDSLNSDYKMNAWNTIGMCYEKLGMFDSAFVAFNNALHLSLQLHNPFWTGLINGNKGNVFFRMGQYDSANVLLQLDYQSSLANRQYDNAANSLQWMAQIEAIQNHPELALKKAREARTLLEKMPRPEYQENLLYTFTQVFRSMNNTDSMDFYMKEYLELHDSLEKAAANGITEIVSMRRDNQASIHRIAVLNKEKRMILLIRNFSILLILLAAAAGYLFFHRERLKLRLRQKDALDAKTKAEAEVEVARNQLEVFTQHIIEKSNLVESLQAQLLHQELTRELLPDGDLSQQVILTEDDWEKFKGLFERVHPGFFQELKSKAPDITLAEQRMAALIKLRVSAKKAATILGISPNSAHKSRQRLRHRLGVGTDTELDEYFN